MNELADPRTRDAVREYLDIPLPPLAGDWADVRTRADVGPSPRLRPAARRGRLAIGAASVTAVAAAGILAMVTFRVHPSPPPSDPATRQSRVTWGMVATLRVYPDAGVSATASARDVITALRERARQRGLSGIAAEVVSSGLVRVRIAGADSLIDVASVTRFERLRVYADSQVVGRGSRLQDLTRFGVRGSVDGRGAHHYMQARLPGASIQGLSAARAERIGRERGPALILSFPDRLRIISEGYRRYAVVSGPPLVDAGDITFERAPGTVRISETARGRIPASSTGTALVVTTELEPEYPGLVVGRPPLSSLTDGEIDGLDGVNGTGALPLSMATTPIRGHVRMVGGRPYGGAPPLAQGTAYRMPPGRPRRAPGRGPTVLVMSPRTALGQIDVVVRRNANVDDLYLYRHSDGSLLAVMGRCQPGPGAPTLRVCGAMGGQITAGRVGPEVKSVEVVSASGRTVTGFISNGWFVVANPADPTDPESSRPGTVIARGDNGAEIGRHAPSDPLFP